MRGQAQEPAWQAVLDTPQQLKTGLRHFLRANVTQDKEGRLHARVLAQQQPFRIQPFVQADAWVVVPESAAGDLSEGAQVTVASLHAGMPLCAGL